MDIHIDFTCYSGVCSKESHPHSQLVLAMEGDMEIEIGGKADRLDENRGAFVPQGVIHSQLACRKNKFLVLNCDKNAFDGFLMEQLAERVFLPVSPAVRQLIGFVEKAGQECIPFDAVSGHWAQLLIGSLVAHPLCMPGSKLSKLAALVEKSLDHPWTVQEMAGRAGLSTSRLHAVFQAEWNTTPREWLTMLRIKKAQQWLAGTDLSIAELAQAAGYSDQTAFTRAMRRLTGMAPAAYRRQQRESGAKIQEWQTRHDSAQKA